MRGKEWFLTIKKGEEDKRELQIEENSVIVKFQEPKLDCAAVDVEEKNSISVGGFHGSPYRGS